MTTAELKINIFRQIDMLDQKRLEKVYLMINKITDNNSDWDNLTEQQQQGLLNAIEEAETGYLVPHNEVMDKARKKITNATHD